MLEQDNTFYSDGGLSPVDVAEVIGKLTSVQNILDPESMNTVNQNPLNIAKTFSRSASFDESSQLIAEMKNSLHEVKDLLEQQKVLGSTVGKLEGTSHEKYVILQSSKQECTGEVIENRNAIKISEMQKEVENNYDTRHRGSIDYTSLIAKRKEKQTDCQDPYIKKSVTKILMSNVDVTPNTASLERDMDVNSEIISNQLSPSQQSNVEKDFIAWCHETAQFSNDIIHKMELDEVYERKMKHDNKHATENLAGFLSKNLDNCNNTSKFHYNKESRDVEIQECIPGVISTTVEANSFGNIESLTDFLVDDIDSTSTSSSTFHSSKDTKRYQYDAKKFGKNINFNKNIPVTLLDKTGHRTVRVCTTKRSPTLENIAASLSVVDRIKVFENAPYEILRKSDQTKKLSSLEAEVIYQRQALEALENASREHESDLSSASNSIQNCKTGAHSLSRPGFTATRKTSLSSESNKSHDVPMCSANSYMSSPSVDTTSHFTVQQLLKDFESQQVTDNDNDDCSSTMSINRPRTQSNVLNIVYQFMHSMEVSEPANKINKGTHGEDLTPSLCDKGQSNVEEPNVNSQIDSVFKHTDNEQLACASTVENIGGGVTAIGDLIQDGAQSHEDTFSLTEYEKDRTNNSKEIESFHADRGLKLQHKSNVEEQKSSLELLGKECGQLSDSYITENTELINDTDTEQLLEEVAKQVLAAHSNPELSEPIIEENVDLVTSMVTSTTKEISNVENSSKLDEICSEDVVKPMVLGKENRLTDSYESLDNNHDIGKSIEVDEAVTLHEMFDESSNIREQTATYQACTDVESGKYVGDDNFSDEIFVTQQTPGGILSENAASCRSSYEQKDCVFVNIGSEGTKPNIEVSECNQCYDNRVIEHDIIIQQQCEEEMRKQVPDGHESLEPIDVSLATQEKNNESPYDEELSNIDHASEENTTENIHVEGMFNQSPDLRTVQDNEKRLAMKGDSCVQIVHCPSQLHSACGDLLIEDDSTRDMSIENIHYEQTADELNTSLDLTTVGERIVPGHASNNIFRGQHMIIDEAQSAYDFTLENILIDQTVSELNRSVDLTSVDERIDEGCASDDIFSEPHAIIDEAHSAYGVTVENIQSELSLDEVHGSHGLTVVDEKNCEGRTGDEIFNEQCSIVDETHVARGITLENVQSEKSVDELHKFHDLTTVGKRKYEGYVEDSMLESHGACDIAVENIQSVQTLDESHRSLSLPRLHERSDESHTSDDTLHEPRPIINETHGPYNSGPGEGVIDGNASREWIANQHFVDNEAQTLNKVDSKTEPLENVLQESNETHDQIFHLVESSEMNETSGEIIVDSISKVPLVEDDSGADLDSHEGELNKRYCPSMEGIPLKQIPLQKDSSQVLNAPQCSINDHLIETSNPCMASAITDGNQMLELADSFPSSQIFIESNRAYSEKETEKINEEQQISHHQSDSKPEISTTTECDPYHGQSNQRSSDGISNQGIDVCLDTNEKLDPSEHQPPYELSNDITINATSLIGTVNTVDTMEAANIEPAQEQPIANLDLETVGGYELSSCYSEDMNSNPNTQTQVLDIQPNDNRIIVHESTNQIFDICETFANDSVGSACKHQECSTYDMERYAECDAQTACKYEEYINENKEALCTLDKSQGLENKQNFSLSDNTMNQEGLGSNRTVSVTQDLTCNQFVSDNIVVEDGEEVTSRILSTYVGSSHEVDEVNERQDLNEFQNQPLDSSILSMGDGDIEKNVNEYQHHREESSLIPDINACIKSKEEEEKTHAGKWVSDQIHPPCHENMERKFSELKTVENAPNVLLDTDVSPQYEQDAVPFAASQKISGKTASQLEDYQTSFRFGDSVTESVVELQTPNKDLDVSEDVELCFQSETDIILTSPVQEICKDSNQLEDGQIGFKYDDSEQKYASELQTPEKDPTDSPETDMSIRFEENVIDMVPDSSETVSSQFNDDQTTSQLEDPIAKCTTEGPTPLRDSVVLLDDDMSFQSDEDATASIRALEVSEEISGRSKKDQVDFQCDDTIDKYVAEEPTRGNVFSGSGMSFQCEQGMFNMDSQELSETDSSWLKNNEIDFRCDDSLEKCASKEPAPENVFTHCDMSFQFDEGAVDSVSSQEEPKEDSSQFKCDETNSECYDSIEKYAAQEPGPECIFSDTVISFQYDQSVVGSSFSQKAPDADSSRLKDDETNKCENSIVKCAAEDAAPEHVFSDTVMSFQYHQGMVDSVLPKEMPKEHSGHLERNEINSQRDDYAEKNGSEVQTPEIITYALADNEMSLQCEGDSIDFPVSQEVVEASEQFENNKISFQCNDSMEKYASELQTTEAVPCVHPFAQVSFQDGKDMSNISTAHEALDTASGQFKNDQISFQCEGSIEKYATELPTPEKVPIVLSDTDVSFQYEGGTVATAPSQEVLDEVSDRFDGSELGFLHDDSSALIQTSETAPTAENDDGVVHGVVHITVARDVSHVVSMSSKDDQTGSDSMEICASELQTNENVQSCLMDDMSSKCKQDMTDTADLPILSENVSFQYVDNQVNSLCHENMGRYSTELQTHGEVPLALSDADVRSQYADDVVNKATCQSASEELSSHAKSDQSRFHSNDFMEKIPSGQQSPGRDSSSLLDADVIVQYLQEVLENALAQATVEKVSCQLENEQISGKECGYVEEDASELTIGEENLNQLSDDEINSQCLKLTTSNATDPQYPTEPSSCSPDTAMMPQCHHPTKTNAANQQAPEECTDFWKEKYVDEELTKYHDLKEYLHPLEGNPVLAESGESLDENSSKPGARKEDFEYEELKEGRGTDEDSDIDSCLGSVASERSENDEMINNDVTKFRHNKEDSPQLLNPSMSSNKEFNVSDSREHLDSDLQSESVFDPSSKYDRNTNENSEQLQVFEQISFQAAAAPATWESAELNSEEVAGKLTDSNEVSNQSWDAHCSKHQNSTNQTHDVDVNLKYRADANDEISEKPGFEESQKSDIENKQVQSVEYVGETRIKELFPHRSSIESLDVCVETSCVGEEMGEANIQAENTSNLCISEEIFSPTQVFDESTAGNVTLQQDHEQVALSLQNADESTACERNVKDNATRQQNTENITSYLNDAEITTEMTGNVATEDDFDESSKQSLIVCSSSRQGSGKSSPILDAPVTSEHNEFVEGNVHEPQMLEKVINQAMETHSVERHGSFSESDFLYDAKLLASPTFPEEALSQWTNSFVSSCLNDAVDDGVSKQWDSHKISKQSSDENQVFDCNEHTDEIANQPVCGKSTSSLPACRTTSGWDEFENSSENAPNRQTSGSLSPILPKSKQDEHVNTSLNERQIIEAISSPNGDAASNSVINITDSITEENVGIQQAIADKLSEDIVNTQNYQCDSMSLEGSSHQENISAEDVCARNDELMNNISSSQSPSIEHLALETPTDIVVHDTNLGFDQCENAVVATTVSGRISGEFPDSSVDAHRNLTNDVTSSENDKGMNEWLIFDRGNSMCGNSLHADVNTINEKVFQDDLTHQNVVAIDYEMHQDVEKNIVDNISEDMSAHAMINLVDDKPSTRELSKQDGCQATMTDEDMGDLPIDDTLKDYVQYGYDEQAIHHYSSQHSENDANSALQQEYDQDVYYSDTSTQSFTDSQSLVKLPFHTLAISAGAVTGDEGSFVCDDSPADQTQPDIGWIDTRSISSDTNKLDEVTSVTCCELEESHRDQNAHNINEANLISSPNRVDGLTCKDDIMKDINPCWVGTSTDGNEDTDSAIKIFEFDDMSCNVTDELCMNVTTSSVEQQLVPTIAQNETSDMDSEPCFAPSGEVTSIISVTTDDSSVGFPGTCETVHAVDESSSNTHGCHGSCHAVAEYCGAVFYQSPEMRYENQDINLHEQVAPETDSRETTDHDFDDCIVVENAIARGEMEKPTISAPSSTGQMLPGDPDVAVSVLSLDSDYSHTDSTEDNFASQDESYHTRLNFMIDIPKTSEPTALYSPYDTSEPCSVQHNEDNETCVDLGEDHNESKLLQVTSPTSTEEMSLHGTMAVAKSDCATTKIGGLSSIPVLKSESDGFNMGLTFQSSSTMSISQTRYTSEVMDLSEQDSTEWTDHSQMTADKVGDQSGSYEDHVTSLDSDLHQASCKPTDSTETEISDLVHKENQIVESNMKLDEVEYNDLYEILWNSARERIESDDFLPATDSGLTERTSQEPIATEVQVASIESTFESSHSIRRANTIPTVIITTSLSDDVFSAIDPQSAQMQESSNSDNDSYKSEDTFCNQQEDMITNSECQNYRYNVNMTSSCDAEISPDSLEDEIGQPSADSIVDIDLDMGDDRNETTDGEGACTMKVMQEIEQAENPSTVSQINDSDFEPLSPELEMESEDEISNKSMISSSSDSGELDLGDGVTSENICQSDNDDLTVSDDNDLHGFPSCQADCLASEYVAEACKSDVFTHAVEKCDETPNVSCPQDLVMPERGSSTILDMSASQADSISKKDNTGDCVVNVSCFQESDEIVDVHHHIHEELQVDDGKCEEFTDGQCVTGVSAGFEPSSDTDNAEFVITGNIVTACIFESEQSPISVSLNDISAVSNDHTVVSTSIQESIQWREDIDHDVSKNLESSLTKPSACHECESLPISTDTTGKVDDQKLMSAGTDFAASYSDMVTEPTQPDPMFCDASVVQHDTAISDVENVCENNVVKNDLEQSTDLHGLNVNLKQADEANTETFLDKQNQESAYTYILSTPSGLTAISPAELSITEHFNVDESSPCQANTLVANSSIYTCEQTSNKAFLSANEADQGIGMDSQFTNVEVAVAKYEECNIVTFASAQNDVVTKSCVQLEYPITSTVSQTNSHDCHTDDDSNATCEIRNLSPKHENDSIDVEIIIESDDRAIENRNDIELHHHTLITTPDCHDQPDQSSFWHCHNENISQMHNNQNLVGSGNWNLQYQQENTGCSPQIEPIASPTRPGYNIVSKTSPNDMTSVVWSSAVTGCVVSDCRISCRNGQRDEISYTSSELLPQHADQRGIYLGSNTAEVIDRTAKHQLYADADSVSNNTFGISEYYSKRTIHEVRQEISTAWHGEHSNASMENTAVQETQNEEFNTKIMASSMSCQSKSVETLSSEEIRERSKTTYDVWLKSDLQQTSNFGEPRSGHAKIVEGASSLSSDALLSQHSYINISRQTVSHHEISSTTPRTMLSSEENRNKWSLISDDDPTCSSSIMNQSIDSEKPTDCHHDENSAILRDWEAFRTSAIDS